MNNPPEKPLALRRPWEPSGRGVIEEYLDDFCLPLAEVMPERDVAEYRMLAQEHLRDLEDEFLAAGMSEHFARHAALHEHGDPHLLGKMLQQEWLKDGKRVLPMNASLRNLALGVTLLHLCTLVGLWLGGFTHPLLFFLLAPLTGWTTGALCATPRWRGRLFLAGASFLAQTGMTTLALLVGTDMEAVLWFLAFYSSLAATFAVKTTRRLRMRQQERLLRTLQKA